MFKMARELFSTEERAQLDEDYETWKQSASAENLMIAEKAKAGLKGAVKNLTS
jgi:hypothetical protein